jgi:outer membrane lipoprotein-sorting protein
MSCLTDEQVARLTLELPEDAEESRRLAVHLSECPSCRGKVAKNRGLIDRLAAAHAGLDRNHVDSREKLLEQLSRVDVANRPNKFWQRGGLIGAWSGRRQVATALIGISATAVLGLLLIVLNSGQRLSAMERMAKELKEVKSYSYKNTEHVMISQKGKTEPGIVDLSQLNYWQAPGRTREDLKIVLSGAVPRGYHPGQTQCDIVSISLMDKPGILIDRVLKTYTREPELRAEDTGSGSLIYPMSLLRVIREESGNVVRELGTKQIGGEQAHGYLMDYPKADWHDVEVWLDTETDLPLEVRHEAKDETTASEMQWTDFRWNTTFDPKLFDTTPPEGYADITPPDDVKTLAEITEALRLYAELSGGKYPPIDTYEVDAKFDADAIYAEMLKLTGFNGPPQPQWAGNEKYQEIQRAKSGLDWIAKITRDKNVTRYEGLHVGPQDKEKILLWWLNGDSQGYRVFYGDLTSKMLTDAEAKKAIAPRSKIFAEPAAEDEKATESQ